MYACVHVSISFYVSAVFPLSLPVRSLRGGALRRPPLPHSAGVAVPAMVDVPGDEVALRHVPD